MAAGGVEKPVGKTGTASVMQQGHTHDGQHGSNPMATVRARPGVTTLHVDSKKS